MLKAAERGLRGIQNCSYENKRVSTSTKIVIKTFFGVLRLSALRGQENIRRCFIYIDLLVSKTVP